MTHAFVALPCLALLLAVENSPEEPRTIEVRDDASLRAALGNARPGTTIRIAPGRYSPGVYARNLHGAPQQPIVIEGSPTNPPRFEGGSAGWQLSDCSYLTLRNILVRGQRSNGINIDDGGSFDTPSHHLTLEGLRVEDVGPQGNNDGIKLSGIDDFVVRRCVVEGWGGQAVDMVGCHRGRIEDCDFRGKEGFSQHTGPQTKGGSADIVIRGCRFHRAGTRAVNIGGSTSRSVFRPQNALYEAKNITVEGCTFVDCEAPLAFVGVDGATARFNTIYRPKTWVVRILQETTDEGFPPSRNGRLERNLIVLRRAELRTVVNIGRGTAPESFVFCENWWFFEDQPTTSARPELPTAEQSGVYGLDPKIAIDGSRLTPQNPKAAMFGALALPQHEARNVR